MQPLVSVCIPTYNSAEFIEETLRSVAEQSYSNIEVVVTDDGSTDDTVEQVKTVADSLGLSIRLDVVEQNQGIAANWNRCLQMASGEYVKLLPADDPLAPDCIARQMDVFDRYKGDKPLALVFCARKIITRSGRHLLTARFYKDGFVEASHLLRRCIMAGTNAVGEPGAVLFPRKVAEKTGLFSAARPYVIDLDYWTRLLAHGDAVALESTLSTFRIDHNLSVRIGWDRCRQYCSMINDMQKASGAGWLWTNAGKLRTLLNELLRRVVHIVFRRIG